MGNAQSLTRTSGALDSFISDLGADVVYERSLSSARFLKTVRCRHRNGPLVVKIFIKPDPGVSLRKFHRRLKMEREALADLPNVYAGQTFVETDKAGYLIRQWVASSLYDRISTRPFLSSIEKKWIAFQLLTALRDARNRKVSHGDIKTENVLVTSWNWVYVSDFASYKPTFLPLDDPSDFSFYFDTSGSRTCYIAPERFYTAEENPDISAKKSKLANMDDGEVKRDGRVTEAMDCFSAGCVIAELFLEGTPLFKLSQLFQYREGEFNVDHSLNAIEDEGVRNLIRQMIALEPSGRPTFDALLHSSRGTVFPECFYSFLHNYVWSVNELQAPTPFISQPATYQTTPTSATSKPNQRIPQTSPEGSSESLPSDSDHRMERIWADYESVEPYLELEAEEEPVMDVKIDYLSSTAVSKPFQDVFPVELHIPNHDSKLPSGQRAAPEDGPALIMLSLVSANIRNCQLPSSKVQALDVFLALSPRLTDEAKLDRMVPYIVELLNDDAALVRMAALRTLIQVLMLVTVITPSNAAIFPEYIIPSIEHLVRDPEVSVRCMYAQCMAPLADTALKYLEMGQALKAHGAFKISADVQEYDEAQVEVSYDASLQDLQENIQDHLSMLLVDPSSVVKRAVLHNIFSLCIFLGRQKTNDVLLSHMITYLNDRDWLLRHAFFESIVDVAACVGGRSLEEYILPLMIQALSDVEETAVAKVLSSLTSLCELGLFQKMRLWELMGATLGFLYHPNVWIRQSTVAFLASAKQHLPPSDVWCILYPSLRHFLRSDIRDIDEQSLLIAMKSALPRPIFDAAVQWAMKADKSSFWKGNKRSGIKLESPKESVAAVKKSTGTIQRKSEDDETQLGKLQQLGMTPHEEAKMIAMRDYIWKLAQAISSFATRISVELETENLKVTTGIELQKLGIVPQTVFLRNRATEPTARPSRLSSKRSNFDHPGRSPTSGTPRTTRTSSIDHGPPSGAPFEDLRRRLATINGSTTSLSMSPSSRDIRNPVPSAPLQGLGLAVVGDSFDRPGSPADSVISTSNSSALKGVHRLQIGSIDSQKAAPAVGSSKANATGLLEAASRMRDGSPDRSGRSSPASLSGTLRPQQRHRVPSLLPISSYDGQEPGISNLLEHLYLDSNKDLQSDFGPKVHEGPVRRRNAGRHSYVSRDGTTRRPDASLIAHLSSHSDNITGLAVSPDHMFFVSSSDDKTVKVWDTARLERNVTSKPRHTYGQHHARVKAICMVESSHCFASAAEDGSLHIVRVHVSQTGTLPKYNKLQVVREHRLEIAGEWVTCMTHYNTDTSSNLVYGTTHCSLAVLDLRTMRMLASMENPRHYGPVTCMCLDRKKTWMVVGTATGVLTLWDLRFAILLKSWRVGTSLNVKSPRIHQCVLHPTRGKGRWIMVALESSKFNPDGSAAILLEVWDVEKTLLMETYGTRKVQNQNEEVMQPAEVVGETTDENPAAAIAALVRSRQQSRKSQDRLLKRPQVFDVPLAPSPDIRAIVVGRDFGGSSTIHRSGPTELVSNFDTVERATDGREFLVTGSEDRKLRLWDLNRVERTAILSGFENETEKPSYDKAIGSEGYPTALLESWTNSPTTTSQSNRPSQRMSLITNNQQTLLKAHQDCITSLLCIDAPFKGGIVSGDRAGVIKVWRVD